MAENRSNELMSNSSSPSTTNTSSSPMIDTNHTSNDSKTMNGNRNSLNAPKYGIPVPNRVFVGGIPTDTNENEVKQLFAKFGSVVSVKIISDRAGVSRGYGFVTYETEEDAKRVMKESDNLLIKGRKLNISVAIKKQQHFSNDSNSRVITNGSVYYNPYALMNTSLYPELVYSSEGIPFYNLGISPQLVANSGVASTPNPYPYTYQTSGLYLTTTQPSMTPQLGQQFQSTAPSPSSYPLVNASHFRLPLNSQNMNPNLNINQMNPYLQLSNTTTPPLSQSSSMPIQMGTVANSMVSSDCGHSMSRAMNAMNLIQPSVYAISSNMQNSTQPMACVQNVHLKADNAMDLCSDNTHLLPAHNTVASQQLVELLPLWPQRVPNIQSTNNTALNRHQYYSTKSQQNNTNETSLAVKDRPDRRNNSSFSNTSHYRKSVNNSNNWSTKQNNSYGQPSRDSNYSNAAKNECQTGHNHNNQTSGAHNHSTPNTNALQGLPFVKHYSNHRFHTLPVVSQSVLNNYQSSAQQPKYSNTPGGQPMVTKMVNGVQIYALANYSGGDEGYGYSSTTSMTPPLTPGAHQNVKAVHK